MIAAQRAVSINNYQVIYGRALSGIKRLDDPETGKVFYSRFFRKNLAEPS